MSFAYTITLLQKFQKEVDINLLPQLVLELKKEENNNLIIAKIREKNFQNFSAKNINLKCSELEYQIYLPDGKCMKLSNVLSYYFNNPKTLKNIYFSCIPVSYVIEAENAQEEQKLKENDQLILKSLKENHLDDKKKFKEMIGNLSLIQEKCELQIPKFKLESDQLILLKKSIDGINIIQMSHELHTESDRHNYVTVIISAACAILKDIYVSDEFVIKPPINYSKNKEGIERRVDIVVYYKSLEVLICISEVKKSEEEIEDCLRENTDQMRAFCICNNKKLGRGISTNGETWIFTQYTKSDEELKVSEPYEILKRKGIKKIYAIKDDYLEFFEKLIGFINESLALLKNY